MEDNRKAVMQLRENTANRTKDYWTQDEREQLAAMYASGHGITEMALHFDRTELAIVNQLRVMRLFPAVYGHYGKKPKCKCPKCAFYGQCKDSNFERCCDQ